MEKNLDLNKNQIIEIISHDWSRLKNMIPSIPLTILQKLNTRLKIVQNNQQLLDYSFGK